MPQASTAIMERIYAELRRSPFILLENDSAFDYLEQMDRLNSEPFADGKALVAEIRCITKSTGMRTMNTYRSVANFIIGAPGFLAVYVTRDRKTLEKLIENDPDEKNLLVELEQLMEEISL